MVLGLLLACSALDDRAGGLDSGFDGVGDGLPRGIVPGELAIDVIAPDRDGVVHRLSDRRGQPVLLEFSSMVCAECVDLAPELSATFEERGGVAVFDVLVRDGEYGEPELEDAGEWADTLGLTYTVVADVDGEAKAAWQPLRKGMPASYGVDADGVILFEHHGYVDADALYEEIID